MRWMIQLVDPRAALPIDPPVGHPIDPTVEHPEVVPAAVAVPDRSYRRWNNCER